MLFNQQPPAITTRRGDFRGELIFRASPKRARLAAQPNAEAKTPRGFFRTGTGSPGHFYEPGPTLPKTTKAAVGKGPMGGTPKSSKN